MAPVRHERLWCTEHQQFVLAPDVEGDLPPLPERVPQATVAAWQAAIRDQLSEQALADGEPLGSLAPEPEEDEAGT